MTHGPAADISIAVAHLSVVKRAVPQVLQPHTLLALSSIASLVVSIDKRLALVGAEIDRLARSRAALEQSTA